MGLGGATVALASAAVSLLVLPAILMLLGQRINKFSVARSPIEKSDARWYSLASWVMKRPVWVALGTTALIFLMALPALGIKFTSVDATVLPSSAQPHQVENAVQQDYPANAANNSLFVVAESGKDDGAKVATLRRCAERIDGVTGTTAPVYLGANRWQFDVYTDGARYSTGAQDVVKSLRNNNTSELGLPSSAATDTYKPVTTWVGGTSATFVDQRATILDRVPLALLIIAVLTFIVLFLMTGSVILPIKAIVMNILTLGAAFGAADADLPGRPPRGPARLHRQGGSSRPNRCSSFAASRFGLSTDYGVFLLGRIKEARDGGVSDREAVAIGLQAPAADRDRRGAAVRVAIGAFSDLADRLHQGARRRDGARCPDRRDDRRALHVPRLWCCSATTTGGPRSG